MKITVIIPRKNSQERKELHAEAIQSTFNQTFTDFHVITCENGTLSENFNKGFKEAIYQKSEFIKILADDDLLTPNSLADLYNGAYPDTDLVIANAANFGDTNESFKSSYTNVKDLLIHNTIHGGTCLYRVSKLAEIALDNSNEVMREDLTTGEEYDLNIRVARAGGKISYIDKEVYKYRIHSGNKSLNYHDFDSRAARKLYIRERIVNRYL